MASLKVEVLLPLIGAPLTSLFLPKKGFQQVRKLAIIFSQK